MNYVGIDIHKRYSVLVAQDERGRKLREARIEGNSADGFVQFFKSLEGPSKAVLEACWNWGLTHDLLEDRPARCAGLGHPAAGQPSGARHQVARSRVPRPSASSRSVLICASAMSRVLSGWASTTSSTSSISWSRSCVRPQFQHASRFSCQGD